jgi:hypothetical protein
MCVYICEYYCKQFRDSANMGFHISVEKELLVLKPPSRARDSTMDRQTHATSPPPPTLRANKVRPQRHSVAILSLVKSTHLEERMPDGGVALQRHSIAILS